MRLTPPTICCDQAECEPTKCWEFDATVWQLTIECPLLACWESRSHPAQQRMRQYLEGICRAFGGAGITARPLGLDFVVDVQETERLEHHYDLENYLTPVVQALGGKRFSFVRGVKIVGGGSKLNICAIRRSAAQFDSAPLLKITPIGSSANATWKESVQSALIESGAAQFDPGPLSLDIRYRVGPGRNWVNLWKPSGDALGPILGSKESSGRFNPCDDRVTELKLHSEVEEGFAHRVDLEIRCSPILVAG